jgi:ABC-type multidrug transport system fused ATPase/permease subunit
MFACFWPYARPYRRWLVVALVFVVLVPVLDTVAVWLFKVLVDDVLAPHDFAAFPRLAASYLVITLANGGMRFGENYLTVRTGELFLADVRVALYRHLHELPLDFFAKRPLGDVLSRLTSDVSAIEGVVLSGATSMVSYGLRILLFGGALIVLSWQLALVGAVVAPIFWMVSRAVSRRVKDASRVARRRLGTLAGAAEEGLTNTSVVRAYNRQDAELARFVRHNEGVVQAQLRATRVRSLLTPVGDVLELIGLLLVIGIGTWELSQGRMTLGDLLVFMAYFGQLYSPLRGVGRLSNSLSSASASAERLLEVLELRPAVRERTAPVELTTVRTDVVLDGVRFRYPGEDVDVLAGVHLTIAAGQTVAIVWSSGAGKSTIAMLLLRHYDPYAGQLRLDGVDLRDLKLSRLRDLVCVLGQESLVFDGTIAENVRWSRPDADDAQFAKAVAAAGLGGIARDLPHGLATRVGQRGLMLSGGQRQRVAIARAMLRDAPVLLLDEPTTGLDPVSAAQLQAPLRRLMAGRTTIVITHHLASVADADVIVVLDRGRIVEQGSHLRLRISNGAYERLYRAQGTPSPTTATSLLGAAGERSR